MGFPTAVSHTEELELVTVLPEDTTLPTEHLGFSDLFISSLTLRFAKVSAHLSVCISSLTLARLSLQVGLPSSVPLSPRPAITHVECRGIELSSKDGVRPGRSAWIRLISNE